MPLRSLFPAKLRRFTWFLVASSPRASLSPTWGSTYCRISSLSTTEWGLPGVRRNSELSLVYWANLRRSTPTLPCPSKKEFLLMRSPASTTHGGGGPLSMPPNNSMQRTVLRAAADADRPRASRLRHAIQPAVAADSQPSSLRSGGCLHTERQDRWMDMSKARFTCPCCGHRTPSGPPGSCGICEVCFWEDDGVQLLDPASRGGANGPSLMECQANYVRVGACENRFLGDVRPPEAVETREPDWRLAQ